MTDRSLHVVLIGHATRSNNLGVGALSVSEVAILRDIADRLERRIDITIVDYKDDRTPYISGGDIRVVDMDRNFLLSPSGYFALARRADVVIDISGGDSFADIYGSKRLKRLFYLKALTHAAGTPLVVAPQTIGPFTHPLSRRLARATLKRSALVATRDRLSSEAARTLGATDVIEACDVALRLPYDRPDRPGGDRPRVGINVSGLLMAGGYTGKNELGLVTDYPALIRRLIAHFRPDCEIHLVPHVIVPSGPMQKEDDLSACRHLADEFEGVQVAPAFASPSEAKSYIAGLDFFMGARMHACIAAFSSGVPVIPMAYSRKFAGLFGTLGYDHTVDCRSEPGDAIFDRIVGAFGDRVRLAQETAAAHARGLEKLGRYENALAALLQRL